MQFQHRLINSKLQRRSLNIVINCELSLPNEVKEIKPKSEYVPPVFRTTGMEPYLMAVSWVSPQGSKIDGTRMKSAPAYIYFEKQMERVNSTFRESNSPERTEGCRWDEPSERGAHHRSTQGEHGPNEKSATDWPNLRNRSVSGDLEPNQAVQPVATHANQSNHKK